MKNTILIVLLFFGASALKAQAQNENQFKEIKRMIASESFYFDAITALPSYGSSVSLTTNPGHFKLNKDRVEVFLPFFGEMYQMGGYGTNGPIEISNRVLDYKVKFNNKKQKVIITFNARNKSERFDFTVSINRSGKSNVVVRSMNRSIISYYGKMTPLLENSYTK